MSCVFVVVGAVVLVGVAFAAGAVWGAAAAVAAGEERSGSGTGCEVH